MDLALNHNAKFTNWVVSRRLITEPFVDQASGCNTVAHQLSDRINRYNNEVARGRRPNQPTNQSAHAL